MGTQPVTTKGNESVGGVCVCITAGLSVKRFIGAHTNELVGTFKWNELVLWETFPYFVAFGKKEC